MAILRHAQLRTVCFARQQRSTCTGCNTASFYYLHNNNCIQPASMPSGYGPNLTTGIVEVCGEPHCLLCQTDKSQCTGCDTASGYYLSLNDSTCIHTGSMPSYNGPNLSNGEVALCSDIHCLDCHLTHLQCIICDWPANYYLKVSDHTCILNTAMPDTFGPNIATKEMDPCSDSELPGLQNEQTGMQ
jgi:hypothetical protein